MKVSSVGAAIIGVALFSCATPTETELPSVELRTDRTAYVMGYYGVLTLTNGGADSIIGDLRYDLVIQRMVGTSWESVDTGPVWRIMEDVRKLAPGASDEQRFQVVAPAFASAGEYRFQLSGVDLGSRHSFVVSSNQFTVQRW
jgi:hypothetical protein